MLRMPDNCVVETEWNYKLGGCSAVWGQGRHGRTNLMVIVGQNRSSPCGWWRWWCFTLILSLLVKINMSV